MNQTATCRREAAMYSDRAEYGSNPGTGLWGALRNRGGCGEGRGGADAGAAGRWGGAAAGGSGCGRGWAVSVAACSMVAPNAARRVSKFQDSRCVTWAPVPPSVRV